MLFKGEFCLKINIFTFKILKIINFITKNDLTLLKLLFYFLDFFKEVSLLNLKHENQHF